MLTDKIYVPDIRSILLSKTQDYLQLIKLRLTVLVIFSAAMGYLFAVHSSVNWEHLCLLLLSGFLITGAANGINQIIERDSDKLMTRTANRPVATERLSVVEASILTTIMGIAGVVILGVFMNSVCAALGLFALLSYAFVYTPLKRISPLAVLAGAFPGAIPPIIGYTAITGTIDMACLLIFAIQFIWQFPHFWSVAWIFDDDYKRAGFRLMPSKEGRGKKSAWIIFICTSILIPLSLLPVLFEIIGTYSGIVIILCSLLFLYRAFNLFRSGSLRAAKQLMFGSFFYLPVVQLILVFGKI